VNSTNDTSFAGRVAIVTGGARGQGLSHALAFARRGAAVVICDAPAPLATVAYPLSTEADLETAVTAVRDAGGRCLGVPADVRDSAAMQRVVAAAIAEYGRVDILAANAAICSFGRVAEMDDVMWDETIEVNLSGVFHALRSVVPAMTEQGYGRIVVTASMAARGGWENLGHYTASKWGVIGLVKSLALEVAAQGVTVNAVCPTSVNTPMMHNDAAYRAVRPDIENPTLEDALPGFTAANPIPVPWVDPSDITEAVLFLASDEARYITGESIAVSAGASARGL
jgi:SDR family mycofactocin-dependent oxidoreductase